eukprot:TRINITY_DN1681_c0_g1_i2.p1 TRINITY_DN1681_c0_g1~~TRINITY_DN1681_c0_g1_i2.p1  ORF type:complete len:139 (-),score=37.38 TRINITY_DN1681_c0_g1_i2:95-511(-)
MFDWVIITNQKKKRIAAMSEKEQFEPEEWSWELDSNFSHTRGSNVTFTSTEDPDVFKFREAYMYHSVHGRKHTSKGESWTGSINIKTWEGTQTLYEKHRGSEEVERDDEPKQVVWTYKDGVVDTGRKYVKPEGFPLNE